MPNKPKEPLMHITKRRMLPLHRVWLIRLLSILAKRDD